MTPSPLSTRTFDRRAPGTAAALATLLGAIGSACARVGGLPAAPHIHADRQARHLSVPVRRPVPDRVCSTTSPA